MIPIGDNNKDRIRTPYVNIALIIINIFVYIYYQGFGNDHGFTFSYATIPAEILTGQDVVYEGGFGVTPIPVHLTILTAMFMHGGIMHLAGNMLYLWVFGDNLENVMGHFKYLCFYLLTGILATLCHVFSSQFFGADIYIPSLGASGAISGILGGYLLMFPRNEVRVLFFLIVIRIPAFITLGAWIGMQLWEGWGSIGRQGGGVAYAAHIGGFIAGLLLVKIFASKRKVVVQSTQLSTKYK
ncbi:MAG: rhomboid family intramembrane serine protease [Chitinophagaceae bacterium]|nr:MAG: rhomboid family intramembrane serine protease [Chitinophagaceae bacterium]